eukprot:scaffold7859_cov391-Pinguiococcus_pyrenoidosus.AAC.1
MDHPPPLFPLDKLALKADVGLADRPPTPHELKSSSESRLRPILRHHDGDGQRARARDAFLAVHQNFASCASCGRRKVQNVIEIAAQVFKLRVVHVQAQLLKRRRALVRSQCGAAVYDVSDSQ